MSNTTLMLTHKELLDDPYIYGIRRTKPFAWFAHVSGSMVFQITHTRIFKSTQTNIVLYMSNKITLPNIYKFKYT